MIKKYENLINNIIDLMGGKENITFFTHCVTRLRFNVKDRSRVEIEKIKKLPGSLGVQWQNGQFQVIIGQDVDKVYKEITEKYNLAKQKPLSENLDRETKNNQKKNLQYFIDKIFDSLSGSLTPLIPALIGCGMIKIILIVMDMFKISHNLGVYQLLTFVGDTGFYFLPIMVGAFAAKKLGLNMSLGMILGGMLIYPDFVKLVSSGKSLNFLGIPVYGATYTSTIFPVILAVAVASPIERFFSNHTPEILRSVLEPLLTILVMIPLTYCLIGPIGSYLGQYLSAAVLWTYHTIGFLGVAIFAAIMPFVIMTGMHGAFMPYLMQMLTVAPKYEPIFYPALIISNIDQGIAALAVALKSKNIDKKSIAFSTAFTAIIAGVTEPAMYGINLKYKTPMYGAMIGSAVGGCVAGLFHSAIYAFAGVSSIITLPLFINPNNYGNLVSMCVAIITGAVVTFIATWFLYKE
ncbi:PTS transporter subunit EIIC [Lactobacillus kullabergensis]|uniref:PTS transporter subunit EIIC n=1 Tax=Lactobacillus kullabergensis TaxID=1218493 RepID=UPI0022452513|nr:PTS transporter subunit EIIC [Lactobacillus kullabergensis]MCX0292051.1 PTS transporter subunit EIIC [Lactobacillus kullabergensis]